VEPKEPAKQRHYRTLVIIGICAATFFFGLGRLALVGPDEPRYAEVAREMYVSGDYISPRLCGYLWFEKPALGYWLSAVSYRAFGVNEFAARLPSAVLATATVLLLFLFLQKMGANFGALPAAIVLATSGIFVAYARAETPDMALAAAMTLALTSGYRAIDATGRGRYWLWLLCGGATGLAVLSKGLVGFVLVGSILLVYAVVVGKWKLVSASDLVWSLAAFMAIAATWYVPVMMRHGRGFALAFFVRHHFNRFTTNVYGHPQPFYFFAIVVILGAMPWSFLFIPAIRRLRSLKPRRDPQDALRVFALIWVALPLIFFSFSQSKLPGYLLPVFPAMAIILGNEFAALVSPQSDDAVLRVTRWLGSTLLAGLGIAFPIYLHHKGVSISGMRLALIGAPTAVGLATAVGMWAGRIRALAAGVPATVISIAISSAVLLFPVLNENDSLRSLTLRAAAELRPGERICYYITKEFAAVFYAEGRVVCTLDPVTGEGQVLNALGENKLASALQNEPSLVIITTQNWTPGLESDPRFGIELLAQQGQSLALRVWLKKQE
jgi:4-amino-4-deoxy-L-arabinose transferase-like glycosyltransferase